MDEEVIRQLISTVESLKLRVAAIEDALPNIVGFYKEEADGSQQGQIKFGVPKTQVAPVIKSDVAASDATPAKSEATP